MFSVNCPRRLQLVTFKETINAIRTKEEKDTFNKVKISF